MGAYSYFRPRLAEGPRGPPNAWTQPEHHARTAHPRFAIRGPTAVLRRIRGGCANSAAARSGVRRVYGV